MGSMTESITHFVLIPWYTSEVKFYWTESYAGDSLFISPYTKRIQKITTMLLFSFGFVWFCYGEAPKPLVQSSTVCMCTLYQWNGSPMSVINKQTLDMNELKRICVNYLMERTKLILRLACLTEPKGMQYDVVECDNPKEVWSPKENQCEMKINNNKTRYSTPFSSQATYTNSLGF